jgi:hypothetical protein
MPASTEPEAPRRAVSSDDGFPEKMPVALDRSRQDHEMDLAVSVHRDNAHNGARSPVAGEEHDPGNNTRGIAG